MGNLQLKIISYIFVGVLTLNFKVFAEDDDGEFFGESTSSLIVEHSFDQGLNPVFTRKGTINIRSITAGSAHFREEGFSFEKAQKLKALAEENGIYRIRVKSRSDDEKYVSSFVKACALVESRLTSLISVNLDGSGNLLGATIKGNVPHCSHRYISDNDLQHPVTDIDIQQTIPAPTPETQSYIQKIEQEKAAKEKGQEADNRSFFSKYWMYIVPFVIIMMVANNMDAGAQGGGR